MNTLYKPPTIPDKYEVIPIHNSDRGSFRRCRRYWDWSSPARHNLTIRADVYGINPPLFFGTGIHYALENYYNPLLKRDPVESFKTWWDIQWRGGEVTPEWLDKVYDLNPVAVASHPHYEATLYKIKGLEEILPDPNKEEFDELFELGVSMMQHYKEYAERMDGFEVVATEHTFSIPVWDYENDCILMAIDHREESPNVGKELEVHARGRMDAMTVSPTDKFGIIDHKTAQSIGEEYFVKLEQDEQCTAYLYAAQVEANYYDLPHKGQPFEEVLYNVLRKAVPRPPTVLKTGMFSVDRLNESTTYEILTDWIARNLPGVALSDKQQGYVDYLREVGDEQFFIRRHVRRNQHELAAAGYHLYLETMDMMRNPRIYPNKTNDWKCRNCQFRPPCLAKDSGADWQSLIKDNYSVNKDR